MMIDSVVLKDTTREEWPCIREKLLKRINQTFGKAPVSMTPIKTEFRELERYINHELEHIRITYHVFGDFWNEAILVLPNNLAQVKQAPAIVTIHGTNNEKGKYGMLDVPNARKNRAYAIELAKRGFVTISPDQYGFGSAMLDPAYKQKFENFYNDYPEWSLLSRRLLDAMRAVDVLCQLDYVKQDDFGVMGNSLGGCAAMYLAAFDERIKAAVLSTGISPSSTNIYRTTKGQDWITPQVVAEMKEGGIPPWDLHEVLALCAPRAVLCLEPINDPHNPFTETTFDCVKSAWQVYDLLGAAQKLSIYVHGDGHDTVKDVRNFAYDWLTRFLCTE